jgi:hypothetical protein
MAGFVIIADGSVDQIVETKTIANREKKDLEELGCEVRIKSFLTMAEAEYWADNH